MYDFFIHSIKILLLLLLCPYQRHSIHSSSSHFWMSGMSKSSAKSGGKPCNSVQLLRSQFKWDVWCTPSVLSSEIFASSAGISCNAAVELERVWMICTRSASAIRSRVRRICFGSVIPERVAVSSTNAENNPISASLRPYSFRPCAKFWKAFANSFCHIEINHHQSYE